MRQDDMEGLRQARRPGDEERSDEERCVCGTGAKEGAKDGGEGVQAG